MASNRDTDIALVAGLDESYSEQEILKVIKVIEKRLRANHDGRIKLIAEIDETVIKDTVNKLQTILKNKDLKIDTKESIQAITKEVNAMNDIVTVAKKASVEKLEFEKANRKVKDSAEDSADAINRERSAMQSLDDVDNIMNNLCNSGREGASVFQRWGNSLRDAVSVYSTMNLLEKSLDKIGEAGREAIEVVKQYDDINVNLQLATGEDKGYVKGLISDYAELGNELGSLTKDVAESADAFLRQGRSIEDTNKLIEDAVVLSKVANTSGENASEILTATINGFQLAASEGSKVSDVLTSIDLHSASSAEGIGDALTKVASMANNAGVSLEKTAAMIATIKDITQDADTTIGTSLKTVLSRMNSIKAGKFIDEETGEALNDVEKVLNSIGFSMRDVNGQFKEAEEIIDEVGTKWKTLDSNTQKAVATAMGGSYQYNKLISLFDNYDKVLELTNIAENSQGQALEKFNNAYLPSLEAKTQALQNSLEQLATTTFDDTLLASILDVSKGIVDLTTDIGILRGALIGLGAGGTLYAFSQLAGFLMEAEQGFANLNEAMNMTRSRTVAMGDMQRLIDLTGGLSQSQTRLLLSTKNLNDVQKITILTQQNLAQGMSSDLAEATARATLNTWGLTTAQQNLTSATVTATNVIRGMYHSLISNPIVAVTLAVTAGATAFHKYKQAQEEVIQSAREASNVYQDNVKSIEDYTERYTELRKALLEAKGNEEETYAVKQQLLELQTELNDKFADEYGAINLVTDAYKDQTEAIKNYNKEVANSFLNEERKGISRATKQMTKDRNYVLSGVDISLDSAEGKELKEIIDSYAKEGMYLIEGINGSTVQINLNTDAQNAYDTINAFENDVREKAKELGDEHLFDSILDTSSISLNKAKETIDEYGDIFKQALMAELVVDDSKATVYNEALNTVEEYNNAVLNSEDPYSDEKVTKAKKNLDEVKAKITENVDEWGKYSSVTDEVFAQADTRLLEFNEELKNNKELLADARSLKGLNDLEVKSFNPGENEAYDRLKESAESYDLSVEELIDTLVRLEIVQGEIATEVSEIETPKWDFSETITNLDTAKEKLTVLDETFSKLFDGDNKTNIGFEDFSAINEAFSDVSGIETYIKRLQEAGQDTEKVTAVMQDLIGAYLEQSQILENVTDENKDLIISMLEEMGIANAEQIVLAQLSHETEMLAIQKQFATEKGYELANATIAEANEFINEANCSDVTKQALAQLALEKINVNEHKIDTSADIDNVIALANAAMASEAALIKLNQAKAVMASVEQYGALNVARYKAGITTAQYNEAKAIMDAIENGTFDYDFQTIDPNKYKATSSTKYTPTYSPQSTVGTSTADALEKANDAMEEAKDTFEETVETIDFFEERIKKLNNAYNLLQANLENVTGAFAKNKLIDAQIGINSEKINNYTDALAMYTQKANEALSKLPSDIASQLKDGAVSIVDYMDDSNGSISEAVSEYQKWSDAMADCKQELAELKQALEDLELQKFNNIIEDFANQFDIRESSKNLADAYVKFFKESGDLVGKSLYEVQIQQTEKQLELLNEEKTKLAAQMNDAINSGYVDIGSEAWLEMVDSIASVEQSIVDAKTELEEFDNELLNLHTEVFNRIQTEFSNLDSELDNLIGLLDDIEVSDDNGNWTKEAITNLGLLAQKYELAQYQVSQYDKEIDKLNAQYASGSYSALEYADKLAELKSAQWDAVNSTEAVRDAIMDLHEARVEKEIEGIEKEIDAYEELIQSKIKALDAEKDLHDYKESIADKTKTVTNLELEIEAMKYDTSAATTAKRLLLEEELAEAKKELEEAEYDHSIESQKEALNQQLTDYQNERNAEIESLRQSLENKEQLIAQSFQTVKDNASLIGQEIQLMAQQHGITVSDSVTTPWQDGENAIGDYEITLGEKASAFDIVLQGIEDGIWDIQDQADKTSISLANTFSTSADNLLGQLTASYKSELTLNTMTNTLGDSLVDTLERGYNISGITSALDSIASSANNVASAAANAANQLANMGAVQTQVAQAELSQKSLTSIETSIGENGTTYNVVDWSDGKKNIISSHSSYNSAENAWKEYNGYAKGVHNLKQDEIAWTQEEGAGSELILSPSRNAILTDLKQGDTVLTKEQTDMLYKWSELNPDMFVPQYARNMVNDVALNQPQIVNRNVSSPTLEFNGTLMHIDKVDNTNIKQMENIANKAIDSLVNKMYDGIKYKSF